MKHIVNNIMIGFLFLFVMNAYSYERPSVKDKRNFLIAYEDIYRAYQREDYSLMSQFLPGIIDDYQSILLDRRSIKLKQKYCDLVALNKNLVTLQKRSTLRRSLDSLLATFPEEQSIDTMIVLLDSLKTTGIDSTYNLYRSRVKSAVLDYYESNPSFNRFCFVISLPLLDSLRIEQLTKQYKDKLNDSLLVISSKMDIQRLRMFKEKYPGFLTSDIDALEAHIKSKQRLSLLKNPSVPNLKKYILLFGPDKHLEEKIQKILRFKIFKYFSLDRVDEYMSYFADFEDSELLTHIEKKMYEKFLRTQTLEDALLYLNYFENGMYTENVKMWISYLSKASLPKDSLFQN